MKGSTRITHASQKKDSVVACTLDPPLHCKVYFNLRLLWLSWSANKLLITYSHIITNEFIPLLCSKWEHVRCSIFRTFSAGLYFLCKAWRLTPRLCHLHLLNLRIPTNRSISSRKATDAANWWVMREITHEDGMHPIEKSWGWWSHVL